MKTFTLDRIEVPPFGSGQALLQFKILGYSSGSRAYIRCIAGKGFDVQADRLYPFDGYLTLFENGFTFTRLGPQSKGGGERFTVKDGYNYLLKQNRKGYGVYLVVNAGGRKDDQITRCPALFYECDGISKDEQWNRLDNLPFRPSLVIDTRNSLHNYYRTTEQEVEGWRRLEQRLIQHFNSDPSIHNEARLMRMAGFYHQKKGLEPYPIAIQRATDAIYHRSQFEELLPPWDQSRWSEVRERETPEELKRRLEAAKIRREQWFNSQEVFPLEICLSRDDRALISGGTLIGQRNRLGFKLASNLIGTADWLDCAGYRAHGEPRLLFEEYCDRCSPAINHREREQIWKSAQGRNPTPSLSDEALENCIKAWQWHQLPESEKLQRIGSHAEPDPSAYQQYLEWEAEQERINQAISTERKTEIWLDWLKRQIKKIKSPKGFGHCIKEEIKLPKIIHWKEGDPVPTPEDLAGKPLPKFVYQVGQRLKLWTALINAGWNVLDSSFMGSGKSHDAGLLSPDENSQTHIWYLDTNHRNVSTETVANNYFDLPPRHDGIYRDGDGKLKLAKTPDQKASAQIKSNCHLADLFNQLSEKGYDPNQLSFDDRMNVNPICAQCPFHKWKVEGEHDQKIAKCAAERGDGYGYRYERAVALSQRQIRGDIKSLPTPYFKENEVVSHTWDYSQDLLIIEEASQHLEPTLTLTTDWAKLLVQIDDLTDVINSPESDNSLLASLEKFKAAIKPLLTGEVKQNRYGLNHQEILKHLPPPPNNLAKLIAVAQAAITDLNSLIVEPDSVRSPGGKWNQLAKSVRSIFRQQAREQTEKNIDQLPPNALIHLLRAWKGERVAIRLNFDKLSITTPNRRPNEIFNAAKSVVFLDATAPKNLVALKGGLDPDTMIEVAVDCSNPLANLTVYNVNLKGIKTNNWSDGAKHRVKSVLNALRERHGYSPALTLPVDCQDADIPIIGIKRYGKDFSFSGWYFNHNRSSNAFAGEEVLVAVGSPFPNLGAIQDEYLCLNGSLNGFEEFYEQLVTGEIIQLSGRQRCQRYPDLGFTLYLIGTDHDYRYLRQYGAAVIELDAFELCPEAGTETQLTRFQLIQAIKQLTDSNIRKLTQKAVAFVLGCTQQNVSKTLRQMGVSLTQLREYITTRLKNTTAPRESPNRTGCMTDWLYTDPWMRSNLGLDPITDATEAVKVIKDFGWQAFREVLLEVNPPPWAAKVIGVLTSLLVDDEFFVEQPPPTG